MSKKIIIAIVLLLSLTLTSMIYMGVFKELRITESEHGPYYLAYKKHQGPYKEVGAVLGEVHAFINKQEVKYLSMFGIYYDDPSIAKESKLRSEVGVILEASVFKKLKASPLAKTKFLQFKRLPRYRYATTEFPYRNMLSIYIGLLKAYPILEQHVKETENYKPYTYKEKGYQENFALELYEKDRVQYLMRLPK